MQQLEPFRKQDLQRQGTPSLAARPVIVPAPDAPKGQKHDYSGMLEYWQMVRRHRTAVVVATVVSGLIAFLLSLSDPRIYQAHTTVEIQGMNDNFLNMQELNPNANSGYSPDSDIQTQVKILTSTSLIRRVRARMTPPSEPIPSPDRLSAWRKALGIAPPSNDDLWQEALGTASGGVVARSSGLTRIVDISCDSTSPVLAASFLNILTEEFIEQSLEARWKATEHTGEWLTNQLRDLRVKLEKSQDELQSYANSTGILVMSDEKNNVNEAKLGDLQKELFSAQADRVAKQSRWEIAAAAPLETLPAVLDDATLQETQANLLELRKTGAQLRVTFTVNSQQVRAVDAQINELNAGLEMQREAIMQRIQNDYQSAARREKLLQDSYEQQMHLVSGESAEMDRYSFLKREVNATRTLYESMLQKMKEASIASALRASNIRVLDKAETPGAPYKPDVPRKIIVGLLTGLCLGIGYAVSRERADRTLQDPGDAPYYLKIPELGVIPTGKLEEALLGRATEVTMASGEQAVAPGGLELSTWNSKTSLVAESIRAALISIVYSGPEADQPRTFVVTSASPKEGKTTVCCNLAIAMAEVRSNVILIDADMRRPRLHNVFKVDNELGLSDLLSEREPLTPEVVDAAVRPSGIPGMMLMVSGSSRHRVSTLLYSPRLPELLELLKSRFMSVMIDTPPMVNIADARILGRHSDGVILVVRSSSTTRDAALMAKQRLMEDGTLITGTILNGWNPNVPGYSHYRNYYSGYVHYYGDRSENESKKKRKKQPS